MNAGTTNYLGIDLGRSKVALSYTAGPNKSSQITIPRKYDDPGWGDDASVWNFIQQLSTQAHLSLDPNAKIVIGAAGAFEFEHVFSHSSQRIQVLGDLALAGRACGITDSGILLTYGTGGGLAIFSQGDITIHKSYGPVVGDLWGGVYLGRESLRWLLDYWTLGKTLTAFEMAVAQEFGIHNRQEYVKQLAQSNNFYSLLPRLGKICVEFGKRANKPAQAILLKSTFNIVQAIQESLSEKKFVEPIALGVQGGIIENSTYLQELLNQLLTKADIHVRITHPTQSLDQVALSFAKRLK